METESLTYQPFTKWTHMKIKQEQENYSLLHLPFIVVLHWLSCPCFKPVSQSLIDCRYSNSFSSSSALLQLENISMASHSLPHSPFPSLSYLLIHWISLSHRFACPFLKRALRFYCNRTEIQVNSSLIGPSNHPDDVDVDAGASETTQFIVTLTRTFFFSFFLFTQRKGTIKRLL